MSDENEQSDEILALQSIYDYETFACEVSKKPYTGEINISCHTDMDTHDIICNGDVFQLKHLSPIVLDFLLPSDYPSLNPPIYELSCHWLTSDQLEMLRNRLMEIWLENCNNVVLFMWISFLQTEVLEYLNVKFPLAVEPEKSSLLTEYSLQREDEAFGKDSHECPICFCSKPGTECLKLGKCGHIFCKECLEGYLSVHIAEGSVNLLSCLVDKCDSQIYPNVIKGLVSDQEFERYDRLLLKNTLAVMNDVRYCPRTTCGNPVVVDEAESFGVCQVCRFAFCLIFIFFCLELPVPLFQRCTLHLSQEKPDFTFEKVFIYDEFLKALYVLSKIYQACMICVVEFLQERLFYPSKRGV